MPPVATPLPARKLSADVEDLLRRCDGRAMTLAELEAELQGRGVALLTMLLAVPFLVPNIPGLSTPFGFAIVLMGSRIIVASHGRLPEFLRRRRFQSHQVQHLLKALLWVAKKMEIIVKPRMHFLQRPGMITLIGGSIVVSGFFLFLPLPIPFTNTLPAAGIILLSAGLMERDGALVLAGHCCALFAWVYLLTVVLLGKAGVDNAMRWFGWG